MNSRPYNAWILVIALNLAFARPGGADLKDRISPWKVGSRTIGVKFKIEHAELTSLKDFKDLVAQVAAEAIPNDGAMIAAGISLGYEYLLSVDRQGGNHGVYLCWTPLMLIPVLPDPLRNSPMPPIIVPADRSEPGIIAKGTAVVDPNWVDTDGLGLSDEDEFWRDAWDLGGKTLNIEITSITAVVPDNSEADLYVQVQQGLARIEDSKVVLGRFNQGSFVDKTRILPEDPRMGPVRRVPNNIETAPKDFEKIYPGRRWMACRDILFMDSARHVYGGFRVIVKNGGGGLSIRGVGKMGAETGVNQIDTDGHYWFHVRGRANGYDRDFIVHANIGN